MSELVVSTFSNIKGFLMLLLAVLMNGIAFIIDHFGTIVAFSVALFILINPVTTKIILAIILW